MAVVTLRFLVCVIFAVTSFLPESGAQYSSSFYSTLRPNSYNCGPSQFNDPKGNITSPNYPLVYDNSQLCNYFVIAPSLSTINFTLNILGMEECCDYIEFTCQSNSIQRPTRYSGTSTRTVQMSFKPCSRMLVRFYTDGSVTFRGFFLNYTVEAIRCQGNCTPVAIGAGYNCTCDANQTDPFVAPPYDQCPSGCFLSSTSSSGYCYCTDATATASTITPATSTTYRPPTPSVPACPSGCYPYQDRFGYPLCYCNTTVTTPTTPPPPPPLTCPFGCYLGYDSFGYQICRCEGTTMTTPCPFGCYNITYSWGSSYCECSTPQPTTPMSFTCPSNCVPDRDFWGTPYCRCNNTLTTTPTPPYCSYPCYLRYPDYGNPYCYCPSSSVTGSPLTSTSCYYPCYYGYDNNYNYRCICNATTTTSGCYYPCYYGYDYNYNYRCICNATSTTSGCYYPCYYGYDYNYNYRCLCNATATTSGCNYPCYYGYDNNWNYRCICDATTTTSGCYYPCYYGYDNNYNYRCICNGTTTTPRTTTTPGCYYPCYYGYDNNWNYRCLCNFTTTTPRSTTTYDCYSPCYYGYDNYWNYRCICDTTSPPSTTPLPGCGVTLTSAVGELTSPNYPSRYYTTTDCTQTITVQGATSIRLTFVDIYLYYNTPDNCVYEWIEITACDGSFRRVCSSQLVNVTIEFQCTSNYSVVILFHPNYYGYLYGYRGYRLKYQSTFGSNCSVTGGVVAVGRTGYISSPGYPSSYPVSSNCYYLLQATAGQAMRIHVVFENMRMPEPNAVDDQCRPDFIKIYCLDTPDSEKKAVCGSSTPDPMTFDCSTVEIWFHSESVNGVSPRFFRIAYYGIAGSGPTTTPTRCSGSKIGAKRVLELLPSALVVLLATFVLRVV